MAAVAGAPGRPVHHVAVTSGQLVPSLAKLLLFRLDAAFLPEDVFSSRGVGKAACFARVAGRHPPGTAFVVVGDGAEEEEAARVRGWPLIRVLLADISCYPQKYAASLMPDATGLLGMPLTELQLEHLAAAARAAIVGSDGNVQQQQQQQPPSERQQPAPVLPEQQQLTSPQN